MPQLEHTDATAFVEELLQDGLQLFGVNQVEKAVQCWRQVLVVMPNEPRALDYLESAGFPVNRSRPDFDRWPEGTGRRTAPLEPAAAAPPIQPVIDHPTAEPYREAAPMSHEEIAVFEVAPTSHDANWMVSSRNTGSRAQVRPRRRVSWGFALTSVLFAGGALLAIHFMTRAPADSQPTVAAPPARAATPLPAASAAATTPTTNAVEAGTPSSAVADPDSYEVTLSVDPVSAQIVLDGVEVGRGTYDGRLPRDGKRHTVEISAPGHKPRELSFLDEAPTSRIRLAAVSRESSSQRSRTRTARRDPVERASEPADRAPAAKPAAPSWAARKSDNINPWEPQ